MLPHLLRSSRGLCCCMIMLTALLRPSDAFLSPAPRSFSFSHLHMGRLQRFGVVSSSSSSSSSSQPRTEVLDDSTATGAEWRRMNDVDIVFPPFFGSIKGVVHFIGGAVVGSLPPKATYGPLIDRIAQQGFCVVATPIPFSVFDHEAASRQAASTFERGKAEVERVYGQAVVSQLPTFGVGHSLGSKLHILLGSQGGNGDDGSSSSSSLLLRRRRANVLISFNNFSAQESVPLLNELRNFGTTVGNVRGMDVTEKLGDLSRLLDGVLGEDTVSSFAKKGLGLALNIISVVSAIPSDFQPDPPTTWRLIEEEYAVPRNLVVQFDKDTIDQSPDLSFKLAKRFPGGRTRAIKIKGTHITPNTPDAVMTMGDDAPPSSSSPYAGTSSSSSSLSTVSEDAAAGGGGEVRDAWFEEAGVKEVTRAASQAAKRELEGLAVAVTDYLKEMAALPLEPYASLPPTTAAPSTT